MIKIINTFIFGLLVLVGGQFLSGNMSLEDSLSLEGITEMISNTPQQASSFVAQMTETVTHISEKSDEIEASVSQLAEGGKKIQNSFTKINEALDEFRSGKAIIVGEFKHLEVTLQPEKK